MSTFSAGNPRLYSNHGKVYFLFMIASLVLFLIYYIGEFVTSMIRDYTNLEKKICKKKAAKIQEEESGAVSSNIY
jgi:Na+-transporting methylmalonyl-CoA/oxaloacetate decarboxylase gamma subunit